MVQKYTKNMHVTIIKVTHYIIYTKFTFQICGIRIGDLQLPKF